MVRVALSLLLLGLFSLYFYKVDSARAYNDLVCIFDSEPAEQLKNDHLGKFRKSMPKGFPDARFDFIQKKIVSQPDLVPFRNCNQPDSEEFKNSLFYSFRRELYPLYMGSSQILDTIILNQRKDALILVQLKNFKSVLYYEAESFQKFTQDCSQIKEMVGQIKLLEHHLKIHPNKRTLAQTSNKKIAEMRMHRNISRQIAYAKKHFKNNEKLFDIKWKKFLEFSSEGQLCEH